MGLGRPGDAVEAYKAALGFEEYQGRGKALANLGQAYTVLGEYEDAIRAFEKATQLHGYALSAPAESAYRSALAAASDQRETVEGWETGELHVVAADLAPQSPPFDAEHAADSLGFGDDEAVADFFNITEDQMIARDREARRSARKAGRVPGIAKMLIVVALAALLIGGVIGDEE